MILAYSKKKKGKKEKRKRRKAVFPGKRKKRKCYNREKKNRKKKKEKEKRKEKRGIGKDGKKDKKDEIWDGGACVCYSGALCRGSDGGGYNIRSRAYVVQVADAEAYGGMCNGVFRL